MSVFLVYPRLFTIFIIVFAEVFVLKVDEESTNYNLIILPFHIVSNVFLTFHFGLA